MTGPITCEVTVDGTRLPDGRPGDHDADPTALSGLTITWGRSSALDQPEPTALTLSVLDPHGGRAFADLLRLGRQIRVTAAADIPGNPGQSIPAIAAARHVTPPPGSNTVAVTIPPAPTSAPGSPPGDWDSLRTTTAGETWTITAIVTAPPGAILYATACAFASPYDASGHLIPWASGGSAGVGTGQQTTITGAVRPTGRYWLGLRLTATPAGHTWHSYPPGAWPLAPGTWRDAGQIHIHAMTLTPPALTRRSVLVAAVDLTDAEAAYDDDAGAITVTTSGLDILADLGRRDVADKPWPAETIASRVPRIAAVTGRPFNAVIDPGPARTVVSRLDIDRRQATPLLQTLASSAGAILWPATHRDTGPYLWFEDPSRRLPLRQLAIVDGTVTITAPTPSSPATTLHACDINLADIRWRQSIADAATRVTVDWRDQSGTPNPTDRTVTLTAPPETIRAHGVTTVTSQTELVTEAAARGLAARLLALAGPTSWRITGIVVDTATIDLNDRLDDLLGLLDGTTRIGRPIHLVGLPTWCPTPGNQTGYLESGTLDYTDGHWRLSLGVQSPQALGRDATWIELPPTWRWSDISTSISWADLTGVGAPTT